MRQTDDLVWKQIDLRNKMTCSIDLIKSYVFFFFLHFTLIPCCEIELENFLSSQKTLQQGHPHPHSCEYSSLNYLYVSDLTLQYTALNEISVSVFIGKICHHPCLQEKELSCLLLLVNQLTKCWHDLAQQKNQGQRSKSGLHLISLVITCFKLWERKWGHLPFTWKTRKFWLENEMVHTIPFETFQKL